MADIHIGYVYGSSGLYTGTDPGTSASSTSVPYGNSTAWSYYPTGTAVDPTVGPTDPPGTVASTGDPSGSGKLTYTAPTGVPAEYYYHHKKPKRNVRRSSIPS